MKWFKGYDWSCLKKRCDWLTTKYSMCLYLICKHKERAWIMNFLPSRNSPPNIMPRAQAAFTEWSNDWPARFELIRAGTRPTLAHPSQRPTYSGLFLEWVKKSGDKLNIHISFADSSNGSYWELYVLIKNGNFTVNIQHFEKTSNTFLNEHHRGILFLYKKSYVKIRGKVG